MGEVILFDKAKKKKKALNPNKKKSKLAAEKTTCESSRSDVDYANMESEEQIEHWKSIEKEEKERFRSKYSDVLGTAPDSASERMQHFSKVMLYLLSDIFHGSNPDTRFEAWMDFCEFYISYFDSAYSDYLNVNKDLRGDININLEQWKQKN